MAFKSALHFIAICATFFVSVFDFSSSQAAGPVTGKPREFTALEFQELRPRLLLQALPAKVTEVDRHIEYTDAKASDYTASFAFSKDLVSYNENQLFRILYISRGDDYTYVNGAMESTGAQVVRMTLQPVDSRLRESGETFELVTKAKPDDKVLEFKADKNDRIARLSDLVYKRAAVKDVLLNALSVKTRDGVIPAGSKAQIVAISSQRASWSFAHNYRLTVRVSPCPQSLLKTHCLARLDSVGFMPDPSWGHWAHPSNVRKLKILNIEMYY